VSAASGTTPLVLRVSGWRQEDFDHHRLEGFPVYSLTRDEKRRELLDLLIADHATLIDQNGNIKQRMEGLALAWHYHPYAWNVRCGNRKTPLELFRDDQLFLKAIEKRTKMGHAPTASGMRKMLRSFSGTQSVSNFRPTAAAAIYRRLLPERGGAAWDMCAGYGGSEYIRIVNSILRVCFSVTDALRDSARK